MSEATEEMSKEILELLNKWKKRGHSPARCAYAMLMRFTAIADEVINEDDLMDFLEDARIHGLQMSELIMEKPKYVN
tara:strand:+ start:1396 stop:1626 length:231 start_codon:yes stop_codon:yes gene_type:complete